MGENPKYVIINKGTAEIAIIFFILLDHADMIRLYGKDKIISAGFCSIQDNKVSVWGESVSLKMKSRPEDKRIIEKQIMGQI